MLGVDHSVRTDRQMSTESSKLKESLYTEGDKTVTLHVFCDAHREDIVSVPPRGRHELVDAASTGSVRIFGIPEAAHIESSGSAPIIGISEPAHTESSGSAPIIGISESAHTESSGSAPIIGISEPTYTERSGSAPIIGIAGTVLTESAGYTPISRIPESSHTESHTSAPIPGTPEPAHTEKAGSAPFLAIPGFTHTESVTSVPSLGMNQLVQTKNGVAVQSDESATRVNEAYLRENVASVQSDNMAEAVHNGHVKLSFGNKSTRQRIEIICRHVLSGRKQCYELSDIRHKQCHNTYNPFDDGYVIRSLAISNKVFLDSKPDVEDKIHYFTPQSKYSSALIIHHPHEICGYADNEPIIGVVVSGDPNTATYRWYKDSGEICTGTGLCCITISDQGFYYVKVQRGDQIERSECVTVSESGNNSVLENSRHSSIEKEQYLPEGLPILCKNDFSYKETDIIGHGSFGVVYRGEWMGTDVAVKKMRLMRRAKLTQAAVRREAEIRCRVRHPNIVQIMALHISSSACFILSEFVDGENLETVLFDVDTTVPLVREKKAFLGLQITRAVAYLHNVAPPIIHRDIKPANVLVTRNSYVTKLCDLGISKVKMTQMAKSTYTLPGTPEYIAPDIVIGKSNATESTDVWSLGCTLLELFCEKECWGDDEMEDSDGCWFIRRQMLLSEKPAAIQFLDQSHYPWNIAINSCLSYDPSERITARDLLLML